MAAPAHDDDFALIRPAVLAVLERHRETRLLFVGNVPTTGSDLLRHPQVIHQPWVDFSKLHDTLRKLGIEILLVPWADTPFNWGKSAGKWMDAGFMGAVTVATPMSDCGRLCRHRETAILVEKAEGWESALEELILNQALRARIAAAARKEVREKFGYDVLAARWAEAYGAVLRSRS
jgi:glycosyltransferase involved in cell wall biosynthesis